MLLSQIPYKFLEIFGKNASATYLTTPLPQTTGSGIRASQDLGFPPATATPIGSGGTPPDIRDVNGVLQYETAWSQWVQAGGPIVYDATFSTAIGGYPNGAVLASATMPGVWWRSTTDNNTSNPDTGGANWVSAFQVHGAQSFTTSGTFTVPVGVTTVQAEGWSGAGGSGGATQNNAGSGGGAGAYSKKTITGLTPGATITVTIGAGGTAGATAGGNGGNGGTTSFGAYFTCTGGSGGPGNSSAGASGGGASGGDLNIAGQSGNGGSIISSSAALAGSGGSAPQGALGIPPGITSALGAFNGVAGQTPGGGPSGGASASGSGANVAGAVGGGGQIIVRW